MDRLGKGRLLLAIVFSAAVAVACSSKCFQIQQALCECQGQTQEERSTCEDNASQQEGLAPPDEAANKVCEQLLPGCEALIDGGSGCDALKTDEGRRVCGLSR